MHQPLDDFREEAPFWPKRWYFFFTFLAFTVYWILLLTIPIFQFAGSGKDFGGIVKMGVLLPFLGIVLTLSSLSRISPIYRVKEEDKDALFTFGGLLLFFPLFLHLQEIREITISEALWPFAWIISSLLGIGGATWIFLRARRRHFGLGAPIILAIFALPVGILFGACVFKGISYLTT